MEEFLCPRSKYFYWIEVKVYQAELVRIYRGIKAIDTLTNRFHEQEMAEREFGLCKILKCEQFPRKEFYKHMTKLALEQSWVHSN